MSVGTLSSLLSDRNTEAYRFISSYQLRNKEPSWLKGVYCFLGLQGKLLT